MNTHYQQGDLARMGSLSDYRVASDDPDPRGWTVRSATGDHIGQVEDLLVDTGRMKVEFLEVRGSDGATAGTSPLLVPVDAAELDASAREVIVTDTSHLGGAASQHTTTAQTAQTQPDERRHTDEQRLTRAEEELRIGTREVERGEVVVNKSVETEHVSTPVQRRVERVRVERRPVEAAGAGIAPTITESEIRVPIVEEEVVVEKRAVVKEEIVVSREIGTETETVTADLRKERVHVEGDDLTGSHASIEQRGDRRG